MFVPDLFFSIYALLSQWVWERGEVKQAQGIILNFKIYSEKFEMNKYAFNEQI